jgi:hypothetical protein
MVTGDCAHHFSRAAGNKDLNSNRFPEAVSRILLSLGIAGVAVGGGNGTMGDNKTGEFRNGDLRILPAYPRRGRQIDWRSPRKKKGEKKNHPSVDHELGETARAGTNF